MSQTTTSSSDDTNQIPAEILTDLRRNGNVHHLFIEVITTTAAEAGVERNSARQEVLKYADWAEDSEKRVSDYLNYGGGFFQELRRGRISDPDPNNQKLLRYVQGGKTTGVQDL